MLDVRRMRLLRELAHRGTIAAVAEALAFTPSVVSQQLSALEREAGVPLHPQLEPMVDEADPADVPERIRADPSPVGGHVVVSIAMIATTHAFCRTRSGS